VCTGRLPLGRKAGYGVGQLVELVVESTLNVFALFYATGVCGLPGALAGLAIGAGLVVDAIASPLIGSVSDGTRSRFGRRAPFMAGALAPIVLTFNLIFALPPKLGQAELFLWLMLLSVTLRVSLSVFTVPFQALGAELSDDYTERSSIAAWRWGLGILGTAAVIVLGYGVFLSGPEGVSRRGAYLSLTLSLTVLVLLGGLMAIRTGLATRALQREAAQASEPIHRRLLGEMAEMLRNRTFRILFAASLLLNVAQGLYQALGLHLGVFFWRLESGQMQALSMTAVVGLVLGAPLAGPLSRIIEKRTMLIIGAVGLAICQALPTSLRRMGFLPLAGDALTGVLVSIALVAGLMFALSIIGFISILPDAADEHEHLFGARREGLYLAGWSFASKSASGVGLLFAGLVLQLIDFPADMSAAAAADIPPQTLAWLGLAGGPGAATFALVGAGLMLFYRVDRRAHARIMTDLVARRDG
jgi:GPH family glycoside/pentoside/hexuronide:cation symporter